MPTTLTTSTIAARVVTRGPVPGPTVLAGPTLVPDVDSTSIVYAATTPTLVLGFSATRPTRNVVHQLLGSAAVAVSVKPAALRTGTLDLLYLSEAEATNALAILADAGVIALTSDDRSSVSMRFVITGDLGIDLNDSRSSWTVHVPFQEVHS